MVKPKTVNQRMADMAKRKKDQGLVKVSVSKWVPSEKAEAVKAAMKRAADREIKRAI